MREGALTPERSGTDERRGHTNGRTSSRRAQANLLALVTALVAMTTVVILGIAVANGALAGQDRDAAERHAATSVADRLVAPDSPLTNRSNVLDATEIGSLSAADLRTRYPVLDGRDVRVTLGSDVLVDDGSVAGGTTTNRVVLVERTNETSRTPEFRAGNHVSLPRRTTRVELTIDPPENVSVSAVRANERTVLHDPDGLAGDYAVSVPRRETASFRFVANGSLADGSVEMAMFPRETRKTQLGVTVDG